MSISIYVFLPSSMVGWKYCLKKPKTFFSAWSHHKYLLDGITGLETATKYARDCADHAKITCNKLHEENSALRDKVRKLELRLIEKGRI